MRAAQKKPAFRILRAGWRDTILLLGEFRAPLLWFLALIVGLGGLYHTLAKITGEPPESVVEAFYMVLTMAFLQPSGPFPASWYLQAFYFITPVFGIGILAQGLADFGILLFNRRERGKEWEMAVASTFNRHIVLIGLGHLGYRVVKYLHELDQDVVVIELQPKTEMVALVKRMGIPVIEDDGTRESSLDSAGIRRARSVILCTQNDSLNLQMALKARSMNPDLDIVVRIFDDDFACALQKQFGFRAISATGMAAPVFAATAAEIDITPPITIDGQPHSVARLNVAKGSGLANKSVMEIEEQFQVSVILLNHAQKAVQHPPAAMKISCGDELAVFGGPEGINRVIQENR